METASLLFLAADEGHLPEARLDAHLSQADQLARQLVALDHSLTVKESKTPFARKTTDPRPSTIDSRPCN